MKTMIFEKNGLPSSLGMLMIVLIIGLVCLIQCILTQPVHAQKKPQVEYVQVEPEPEIRIEEWMINPGNAYCNFFTVVTKVNKSAVNP